MNADRRAVLGGALRGALTLLAARVLPAFAQEKPAEINIDNFVFSPETLTVAAGTKVTFTNRDDIPHTVVSQATPPIFRSHALDTDEFYTYVFDKPGSYPYFCSLHPHMQGTVVVT